MTGPGTVQRRPREAQNRYQDAAYLAVRPRTAHPPSNTEPCSRRFGGGLQNAILAFQPPWYPTETPYALRRATQARRRASTPTTPGGA